MNPRSLGMDSSSLALLHSLPPVGPCPFLMRWTSPCAVVGKSLSFPSIAVAHGFPLSLDFLAPNFPSRPTPPPHPGPLRVA